MKQSATLDTSFWINAFGSGLLPHVLDRFDLVFAPAVAAELVPDYPSGRDFRQRIAAGQLREASPGTDSVGMFGPGERGALNLAIEHPEWLLFVDDRRPFDEAARRGLPVVSSPVLVVTLFRQHAVQLGTAVRLLAGLTVLGTVSPRLLGAALHLLASTIERPEGPVDAHD